ncbi:hypothetical protein Kpol_1030p1 [Vanderwaltozyma polyspora DSM 70294]|uniref:Deacetylase sirtuin-type domain-containing protein n=1 Tax=Vanderwaltozyma polyspora (strain ATCC 22028 / DSM 70294 / BCRC 21397 / CBS 2163 / NBRC 10782 / NRRL Y-8283 / UCD 57-17) TaxID=436907 RepID=A7TMS1_VANPO|nr:uncharacterized protein Kpol_1030p1 [Vanderwaltozyma polyspora DSM 70294]EDO16393.1 hypothetical protein Kpol_1030p1 [Vanderwaltozyma polyspora DSM 70294]
MMAKGKVSRELPLTPPSSMKKGSPVGKFVDDGVKIVPKQLLTQLKKNTRKPRLKFRPAPFTLLNIDDTKLDHPTGEDVKNIEFLSYALKHSRRVIVGTGAGVSVAAGIPDFRSSQGLFTSLKTTKNVSSGKELFDYNRVYSSDNMSIKFNEMIKKLHKMSSSTEPTAFHELINSIALDGRLQRLYTQNIDGLDVRLPHLSTKTPLAKPAPKTIQLHGSIHYMECNKCSKIEEIDTSLFQSSEGDVDETTQIVPSCKQCLEFESVRLVAGLRSKGVGRLRPRVVLYNEVHPEGDLIGEIANLDIRKKPDCLIIAGTSLTIPGVKSLCKQFAQKVRDSKGIVIYMNKEMPSKSVIDTIGNIDLIVLGDCQKASELL